MANGRAFDRPSKYQIRVKGVLDGRWSAHFDGLTIMAGVDGDDETVLSGLVADQAALHGLLARIRDLDLPLLAVKRLETGQTGG